MRIHLTLIAILLCSLGMVSCESDDRFPAAPPGTILYGGDLGEVAGDIIELDDGNFLIVGGKEEKRTGRYDIMLIKIDRDGNELWTRILEDKRRNVFGHLIRKTAEGYAIMVLENNDGGYEISNIYLEQYTEDFDLIRRSVVVNPTGYFYGRHGLQNFYVTPSGAFLVETNDYDQVNIIKVTPEGISRQPMKFGNYIGVGSASVFTSNYDGGYVIAHLEEHGSSELELSFFDEEGEPTGRSHSYFLDPMAGIIGVKALPDTTYMVSYRKYEASPTPVQVVHLGLNGDVIKQVTLEDQGNFTWLFADTNGDLALFGNSEPINDDYGTQQRNIQALTIDEFSNKGDRRRLGGSVNDEMKSVIQTSDGRYAIVGYTRSYRNGNADATLIFYEP